jgi:hypothetical protein
MKVLSSAWFAIIVPALVGLACGGFVVRGLGAYGLSLFIALPLLVSTLASFCWSLRTTRSLGSAYGVGFGSLLLLGAMILGIAIDGLVCLVMALPLAAALCAAGAMLGQYLARLVSANRSAGILPCLLIALFPPLAMFESSNQPSPTRTVTTAVTIKASPARVWQTVIAFPPITQPPNGIFRFGFAYPVEAQITGSGVGAVRYCRFSTGSFVEPITEWNPPRALAFDVTSCPEPMQEFSPYRDLHATHLKNYMVSHHGEFRILQNATNITLQGTTWYSHSISPQWYWGPISDFVIHRIHQRVLDHIKDVAEASN